MKFNRKTHAIHNKQACELLKNFGEGKMNDWIVTTAFYSALHFVLHAIFPLPGSSRVFQNFDAYYISKYPEQTVSKHTVTKNLVSDHFTIVSDKYHWLLKESFHARYRSYSVNNLVAKRAMEYLAFIEEYTGE